MDKFTFTPSDTRHLEFMEKCHDAAEDYEVPLEWAALIVSNRGSDFWDQAGEDKLVSLAKSGKPLASVVELDVLVGNDLILEG